MSIPTTSEPPIKRRNRQRTKQKASGSSRSDVNPRSLQITKLVRKFLPTTVNGAGRNTIIKRTLEKHPTELTDPVKDADSLSKKVLCEYIKYYVSDCMADRPKDSIHMTFDFKLDKDFPFDLKTLKIDLCVPAGRQAPLILVLNQEVPRGFAANVERGFRTISDIASKRGIQNQEIELVLGSGLLSQLQTLIKYLEFFLQQEKRPEVTIVMRAKTPKADTNGNPRHLQTTDSSFTISSISSKSKASSRKAPATEPLPSESGRIERDRQLGELQHKLSSKIRLFKKTDQFDQFKITVPVSEGLPVIPALWSYNRGVEIMMTVPAVWPPESEMPIDADMLRISLSSNFHNNTLLRYKKVSNADIDLFEAAKDYKQLEVIFSQNLRQLNFPLHSLLGVANTIKNHLFILSQPVDVFSEWQDNVTKFESILIEG